jgi:hypothetical protein
MKVYSRVLLIIGIFSCSVLVASATLGATTEDGVVAESDPNVDPQTAPTWDLTAR